MDFCFLWFCVNYTTEGIVSQAWDRRREVGFIWAVAAERHADLVWGRWASPRGAIFLYRVFYCFMCQTISILIRLNWAKAFVEMIKTWFYLVLFWITVIISSWNPAWKHSGFPPSPCFLSIWPLRGHATWSRELLANRSDGFKCVSVVMAAEPHWQARLQWLKVNSHVDQSHRPLKQESILADRAD